MFPDDAPAARVRSGEGGGLPPTLAARAFGPAWVVAVLAHFLLVGVALLPPSAPPAEEPLVRLVFVEPPPPPPAPLGAPNGTGTVPAIPEPVLEPKAPEQPKEPVQPEVKEPERLQRVDAKAKPKPKPKPKPQAKPAEEPRREPAPAEIAPGIATGSVSGEAGGVVGGVAGGIVGGMVGGSGTAPVPAGQVAHPPTLVHRVAPVYPDDARRREVEGLVVLEAVLDREGRIEPGVKVVRSIPALDDEALRAVQQWRFRPARDASGHTLRVILEVPIRFVLR
jgi:protein TonB